MILDEEPEDPSWLLDHDWLEINKLRRAYKDGGDKALDKALVDLLETDAMQFGRIACAFDPNSMLQRFKDLVEEAGYTFQGLVELGKKRRH